jgi:alanyl-tRNA synthetase
MANGEYDIPFFKENEFIRKHCDKCGSHFWTRDKERQTCGDAPCELYSFIGKPIFKEEKSPDEIRELFLSFFEQRSHTRMKRYPVVARWRDDIYLNIASISNFQPFVTSGKVPPPANPLVISQPCIRLEDLESIGKSGRHLTAFEMMGHHAFNTRRRKELYWKNETVTYCDEFLRQFGVGGERVVYKEAPWMGGGNAGPCLEVIVGGLELATLVFMDLERSPLGEISLKGERYGKMDTYIVDTGYGLERFVWASKGTPTVYDAMFPSVIKELVHAAGIEHPMEMYPEIVTEHARLAGSLKKGEIAKRLDISLDFLKSILEPLETIYVVADHTKCLAFMLADGIVPSNAKEGYLARLVLRRAFRMLKSLGIEMPLEELILLQIKTLRNSFPELEHAVDKIVEIVSLEKSRYDETLLKGERIIQQDIKRWAEDKPKSITLGTDRLIYYYDTHGLPPEFVNEVVAIMPDLKAGTKVDVKVPENFYSLVAHEHGEERREEKEIEPLEEPLKEKTKGLPATRKLYYEEPYAVDFEAKVLDSVDGFVILDQTLFYPEGGGQPADMGYLTVGKDERSAVKVVDVRDAEGVILHKIENAGISKGATVYGHIDIERRNAHKRHHSATHIVIHSARKVLGDHIWQAGAQKGEKRARLDITHFKRISDEERRAIEMLANKMVMENKEIKASFMDRNEAEQKYGFRIYQGGVPVGEQIRIVRTGADEDVQACAGTHLSRTGEVGPIKIVRTERIQDGIERIEYSAGEAAVEEIQAQEELIRKSAAVLKVPPEKLPSVVERFFEEWKQLRKENERLHGEIAELELERLEREAREMHGAKVIAAVLPDADMKELLKIATQLANDNFLTILIGKSERHASAVSSVPAHLRGEIHAGEIIKQVCEVLGGSGGGKGDLAQGGGANVEMVEKAREQGLRFIEAALTKK